MPKHRNNTRNTLKAKRERGDTRRIEKKPSLNDGWDLGWFVPSPPQNTIIDLIDSKDLVVVRGSSGTGKTTTVLWKALDDYRRGVFEKVILLKTPMESGSDTLGFLSGDKQEKLQAHVESTETVFYQFMSKEKLRNDKANGNIVIDVPNYLQGKTFDHCILILEEAQNMTPDTIKLCAERAGVDTRVVVIGDSHQTYGIKKRPDGLKDLISKVTEDYNGYKVSKYRDKVGFMEMSSTDNMRSTLSRFITELYEGGI